MEKEEFGSVGRIKGETSEWVMILLKITLSPTSLLIASHCG